MLQRCFQFYSTSPLNITSDFIVDQFILFYLFRCAWLALGLYLDYFYFT